MEENRIEDKKDDGMETDYIKAINELKANSVSKEDYLKLKQENRNLLDSLVKGETINEPAEKKDAMSTSELRKELYGKEHNNLETIDLTLKLRKQIMDEGGTDPFLPYGQKIVPTDEDIASANRVAEVLQQCVDYAQGDSEVFTNELQRRTIDTAPRRR